MVAMVVVAGILGWIGYAYVTTDAEPKTTAAVPIVTNRPRATQPANVITVPPGQDAGDDSTPPPPARSQQPVQLPPRYDQPPAGPLAAADLKAASDRAMAFVEVFANGRWDDRLDDKINSLRSFVPEASVDVVLAQFERTRPKESSHEAVTFRVTGAKWWSLSDRQATLLVTGERRVSDDSGDRTAASSYLLTLVRAKAGWAVSSARDPSEGDVGMGTP
jgi:hypothetical protein